jgi:hypothetical protein
MTVMKTTAFILACFHKANAKSETSTGMPTAANPKHLIRLAYTAMRN